MYAIITSGGKQYKVTEGDQVRVEALEVEVGDTVELDKVLMVNGEDGLKLGKPYLDGAKIQATVSKHGRGKKILVYKHKKNYHRRRGHRQNYTELKIDKIEA